jgi:3-hydroxy acid dehydrogenase / malonic semialdehyde reductase
LSPVGKVFDRYPTGFPRGFPILRPNLSFMQKTAFVTGATSGIGLETARLLHQKGYRILASGRRQDRLDALQNELGFDSCLTLCFDVRDRNWLRTEFPRIDPKWLEIDVLVNNAGNAHGQGLFQEGDWQDWEDMMDINVKGLLAVTEAVVPHMLRRGKGHIVNIGSIAGDQPYAKGAVYCASKAAVSVFTESLRLDLNAAGIKVSEIRPGMVETEFSLVRFKGNAERAKQVYQGVQPLTGRDVAEVLVYMIEAPVHVNLSEVVLMPLAQASTTVFNRNA